MAAVVGSIYASLKADAGPLTAGLNQAGSRIERFEKNSQRQLGQFDRRWQQSAMAVKASTGSIVGSFKALGAVGLGGLIGAAAGIGVVGLVRQVGDVASAIAETGAEAQRAGISFRAFQELSYLASQNKIGVDALTDGIKELQLRADEFVVTGAGSAAESFKRLGYTAEELNEKLKDPSALFTEIIGKLGKLDKAAQIRVSDELFGGTGGEKFVSLIAQGEQRIHDTIDRAHELGRVMSDETLAKARELDRAFSDVANTVSTGLQQSIVNATWALFDFLQQFQAAEDRSTASLENKLRDLGKQRIEVEYKLRETESAINNWSGAAEPLGAMRTQAALLREELKAIADQELPVITALDARTPITAPSASTVPTVPGSGSTTRDKAADDAEKQRAAVEKLIASLADERSLLGLSEVDQAKLTALRQAGAAATTEQRAQIVSLIETTYAERESIEQVAAAWQSAEDQAQSFAGDFVTGLRNGEDAIESLSGAIGKMGDKLIDLAIDQSISLLFSSLASAFTGGLNFTPGAGNLFADGGFTGYGAKHQPAGVVHAGEYVFSADAVRRIGVGNLEMLHKGYADGGYVLPEMPSVTSAASRFAANSNGAGSGTIQVFYQPTNNFPEGASRSDMNAVTDRDRREFERELPGMISEGKRRARL